MSLVKQWKDMLRVKQIFSNWNMMTKREVGINLNPARPHLDVADEQRVTVSNSTLRSRNTIIRKMGILPSFLYSLCNNLCCLYLKEKLQCVWIKQRLMSSSKLEFLNMLLDFLSAFLRALPSQHLWLLIPAISSLVVVLSTAISGD